MAPKKKSVEETYQMLTQREHILKRPDTYIGSVCSTTQEEWVFSEETKKIIKKTVKYTPGFLKIFDEIITNATDHASRDQSVTYIKVDISKETGEISVANNGAGIPVVIHDEHNIYVPEMIFGHLLTGSNFDDTEERSGAGRNGYGATCTNIFSKKFRVETVDGKKKFVQTYTNNMENRTTPKVTDNTGKSYTKITFTPDYQKFEMSGIDDDTYSMLMRRVYECIACTGKTVNVFLNGDKLSGKGLGDYSKYFFDIAPIAHEINGKWEYLVYRSASYNQVSFVNGNNTTSGGKHVDYILNQITTSLKGMIETKMKIQEVKTSTIKDNFFIFVNAVIINPKFNSQTKDILTTPVKDFGKTITVSDGFIKKIFNSPITKEVVEMITFKERKKLDKNVSTSKKSSIIVKNLEDATHAGTNRSKNCSLILTEGLSAATFAISGLSVVGRTNYGVYSLKGKVLNIREATQSQLEKNEEILNIKKIMGLHNSKKYDTPQEIATLRYGNIIILADSDVDGVHISALVMNFIEYWWPALVKIPGFIRTIKTPVVKATKGAQSLSFFNEMEYEKWAETATGKWNKKYYKGLGTSTSTEAKEVFKDMKKNLEFFITGDVDTTNVFKLAFDKKMANDRKIWLQNVPKCHAKRDEMNQVTYSDYINKELIHFSNYDNIRSLPSIMDGLKPSQRKVLYTAFKRNLKTEIKVAQFGSAVAELTAYHHGEVSLSGTIVNMAQTYTGSNNINLLEPCGQFGTKYHLGNDAASPRYIFTHLTQEAFDIYNQEDSSILDYNMDNGVQIEPVFYVPSIPMVLVNGVIGIGTGYATNIPCYNPKDIVENMKLLLQNKKPVDLVPWYKGFKGKVVYNDEKSFTMTGVFNVVNSNTIRVTEVPIDTSIAKYKEFLETFEEVEVINNSTEDAPDFTVKFKNVDVNTFDHKKLKLETKINTTNMHMFDTSGMIKKYDDPNDVIREFLECKLKYNKKRKSCLVKKYNEELLKLSNKHRFLEEIIDNKINVYRKTKTEIDASLSKSGYDKIENSYNYLSSMPISSFNKENMDNIAKLILDTKKLHDKAVNTSVQEFLLGDIAKLKLIF
jgi:DNA topoisomerase-2